jgi:hypothetical protein
LMNDRQLAVALETEHDRPTSGPSAMGSAANRPRSAARG